jgi:hypothetical protein
MSKPVKRSFRNRKPPDHFSGRIECSFEQHAVDNGMRTIIIFYNAAALGSAIFCRWHKKGGVLLSSFVFSSISRDESNSRKLMSD